MIESLLNAHMPEGWRVTTVTYLDPCWQALATDDEHCACGTGETIEDALAGLAANILAERFIGRLSISSLRSPEPAQASLASILDRLRPKLPTIARRI